MMTTRKFIALNLGCALAAAGAAGSSNVSTAATLIFLLALAIGLGTILHALRELTHIERQMLEQSRPPSPGHRSGASPQAAREAA